MATRSGSVAMLGNVAMMSVRSLDSGWLNSLFAGLRSEETEGYRGPATSCAERPSLRRSCRSRRKSISITSSGHVGSQLCGVIENRGF